MIQRIQTVWLLVAALTCVVCLCLPVGQFYDMLGCECGRMMNLWVTLQDADMVAPVRDFTPWALFALLVLVATGLLFDIALYRYRILQSRIAMLACIVLLGWYAAYGALAYFTAVRMECDFRPTPWAALPAVACILCYLAFRAILKDEMLVRSLDRLR